MADVGGEVRRRPFTLFTLLLWVQGLYYLLTGVWPLASIETFQMVTGPKTDHLQSPSLTEADHWLVMTVGVLITSVALTLLVAAWRRSNPAEAAVLAITCAVALTAIDVIYVLRDVISRIYLVDAAVEVVLILVWLVALTHEPGGADVPSSSWRRLHAVRRGAAAERIGGVQVGAVVNGHAEPAYQLAAQPPADERQPRPGEGEY
jgi:hypothetical protein